MTKVITLPKLQPWQEELYKAVIDGGYDIYCCKAKRQVGKSVTAVCLLITFCLRKKCVSMCIEPTQAQCRRVFKQICDFLDGSGAITSSNSTLLTIEFANGSELLFKSVEQGENLRGYVVSGLLVIDEGAQVPQSFYETVYPTVDANRSPILVISTPLFADSSEFYTLYMRGLEEGGRVKSFDWAKYDTSIFLPPDKLEYYRSTMSPLKFKSEYLAEFITEHSYCMGDINASVGEYSKKPPVYGGIDWGAGNGNDFTVLTLMDEDAAVTKIWAARDREATEQIDIIANIINSYPSLKTITIEQNSIGEVFYSMLKKKTKKDIRKFVTTNDSKRRIIEQLITAFAQKTITIPYDEELLKQLQHYNIEKTAKGGYTYNGADGVNDDYVVSLALALDTAEKGSNAFSISFA